MKKYLSWFLALALMAGAALPVQAAGLSAFSRERTYSGQFADVDPASPVAGNVAAVYELGLMNGVSDTAFAPKGSLTVAQAVVVAGRIHSAYYGKTLPTAQEGQPWYAPAVDYGREAGILGTEELPWTEPVDRGLFAQLLGAALPDEALPVLSSIEDNSIPDVKTGDPHAEAVYRLYRAGVLTGSDQKGTFGLRALITRGAASALISRLVEPDLRKAITLEKEPVQLVPLGELQNLKSLRRKATDDQMAQAYAVAAEIVTPLAELPREDQLLGIAVALRQIFENGGVYTTESSHYNDPYGYFVEGAVSCAGCTRATGLCLNMLGIPYEHVNENQWTHQWCRVPVGDEFWICDAFGLACGPEPAPYQHPYL